MIRRALLLLQQSRFDLAEQELRKSLAEDPEEAVAHALLAFCLGQQDRLQEADGSARQAIALAPDEPYCHYALGWISLQRKDLKTARQAVEQAIRLDPEKSDYHGLHALIYLQGQRWREALDAANEGLTHDPANQECLNHRATALVRLGRHEDAHQTIGQALQEDPENALTHANLGWAYLHKRQHQKALEHFSEALRLDPNFDFARYGLVEALKARYFLYRWLLQFFLWLGSMPPQWRGGLIIGAYVVVRVLGEMAQKYPSLGPFVLPIVSVYAVFVLLTWVIDPAFNLLLQCNKYGRHALSKKQRYSSAIFGLLLLGAVASVVGGVATGHTLLYLLALNLGLLTIPAPRLFENHDGKINRRVAALVVAMTVAGTLAVTSLALGRKDLAATFTGVNVFGIIAFTWLGMFLGLRREKV